MGVGDRKEPNSGLWGKVDLEDIPPSSPEVPAEPNLLNRKGTLMGFAAPAFEARLTPPQGMEAEDPAARSTAPPAGNKARPPVGRPSPAPFAAVGKTIIGGSFASPEGNSQGAAAASPGKTTLLGVPAPVLEHERPPSTQPNPIGVSRPRIVGGPTNALHEAGAKPQAGTLGRFRIKKRIGSGRAGAVFLAERVDTVGGAQFLAIKVLKEEVYQEPLALKALFREARLAALMEHRNVVKVVDIGYHNRQPYLVMDYVDGLSLAALFAHPVPVPLAIGMRCLVDALYGLDYAHKLTGANGEHLGLVHCDVSPQNILVGVDGVVRVTDFGVARTREEHGEEFMFRGKPEYAAPEVLGGEQEVSPESDVYSVGAVLFRLATGVALYSGKTDDERRSKALTQPPPGAREVNPGLPKWVDDICARALDRNPGRRYATCLEMAQAIERDASRDDLLADRATVGSWVNRVRRSLNGEEVFDVRELGAIADVAKKRPQSPTAATRMNAPVPVIPPQPPPEPEESAGLQARIGLGSAALLLVLVAGFWALLAPNSFKKFVKQEKGITYLSQTSARAKASESVPQASAEASATEPSVEAATAAAVPEVPPTPKPIKLTPKVPAAIHVSPVRSAEEPVTIPTTREP
jgi:eukaryotic-like serine/threonine-protein kinase